MNGKLIVQVSPEDLPDWRMDEEHIAGWAVDPTTFDRILFVTDRSNAGAVWAMSAVDMENKPIGLLIDESWITARMPITVETASRQSDIAAWKQVRNVLTHPLVILGYIYAGVIWALLR